MDHNKIMKRDANRASDQIRNLAVTYNVFPFAAGSVLFEMGRTKILCAVSLQAGVPFFLRGKNTGWLTAEYAMLPAATSTRTVRESSAGQRSGRSIEISRLIGRVLRTVIDLDSIGEYTLLIDCDVLQADGGTRTASINAACLALRQAQQTWLEQGFLTRPILKDGIAALAVCCDKTDVLLDPDYAEDSNGDADFNFIMTESGKIIEIQGGAEKNPIEWDMLDRACQLARKGAQELFSFFYQQAPPYCVSHVVPLAPISKKNAAGRPKEYKDTGTKLPLFSLQSRLQNLNSTE